MKLQLPNSISSQQDVTALLLELRGYANWYSHASIKQRTGVTGTMEPPAVSDAAATVLNDWANGKTLTAPDLDDVMNALEQFKDTAPTISITLAAPATNSLKQTLVAWCRANIAPDVLVTFRFNSTLLGGMVVRYGSHIFDWSFRRQILANRQHFPEVLRRV